jgi:hypothetical protein
VKKFMEIKLAGETIIVIENQLQSNFMHHKSHMT